MEHTQYCWINQKGAGTGKTYSCVGLITKRKTAEETYENFSKFNTFVYLSKMNTAKAVIKEEFISQYEAHNIHFNGDYGVFGSQIPEASGKVVVVSTIDSMVSAFTNKELNSSSDYQKGDYFKDVVAKFTLGKRETGETGLLLEAPWNKVKLSTDTLIVIDECQDLDSGYVEFFMRQLTTAGTSFYLMGDILQSVVEQNNIFNFLTEEVKSSLFPNVKFINVDSSGDTIIRFHSEHFVTLANRMVDFKAFGANKIGKYCGAFLHEESSSLSQCKFTHDNEYSTIVEPRGDTSSLFQFLEEIVEFNNYQPEDLLFITPIVDTAFMYQLETEVNNFWGKRLEADRKDDHRVPQGKYCLLQSSKYGRIDLASTADKTRILSIHAAKGMGATMVIVVNLTDRALKSHQTKSGDLKYESMVHVALTRQKENLLIYFNGNIESDVLANRLLDGDSSLPEFPAQKRCGIPLGVLADGLRNPEGLEFVSRFEKENFLRSRMGRLVTGDSLYRYLEPSDVKIQMMVNTMMETLDHLGVSATCGTSGESEEFKFLKPCVKRLVTLKSIPLDFSEEPPTFKYGDEVLFLPRDPLEESLLDLVHAIREKLEGRDRRIGGTGSVPFFCVLESYIIVYLLHKIAPFTIFNPGNIYHRIARSVNQGPRGEYHHDSVCTCLEVLDKNINVEREDDLDEDFCLDEDLDLDDDLCLDEDLDLDKDLCLGDESQVKESHVSGIPGKLYVESLLNLIPERSTGYGTITLAQAEDTLDFNCNFFINIGISDYFISDSRLLVNLTVPEISYVNFMEEITLPIMLYSYIIFKMNSKIDTTPLGHPAKGPFGLKPRTGILTSVTFYVNRHDNLDRRIIQIPNDQEFFEALDPFVSKVITKEFTGFLETWIKFYKELEEKLDEFTPEDLEKIRKDFGISGEKLLEEIKSVPSEIVGRVLDSLPSPKFNKIFSKTVSSIVKNFITHHFVEPL